MDSKLSATVNRMKCIFFTGILLVCSLNAKAQRIFFKSEIDFSPQVLGNEDFYSSFLVLQDKVIFNAADYNVYAFETNPKEQYPEIEQINWQQSTFHRSNIPPMAIDSTRLLIKWYESGQTGSAIVDQGNGEVLQRIPIDPQTPGILRDNLLYLTGIYDGGQLICYDLVADSIRWSKFIAHGVSRQPFYDNDFIFANAEGDQWFKVDYNGNLIDTNCTEKPELFVDGILCTESFVAYDHSGTPIYRDFAEKQIGYFEELSEIKTSETHTALMSETTLLILGDRQKIVSKLNLQAFENINESWENELFTILYLEDETVWFLYEDQLIRYNFITKKKERLYLLGMFSIHSIFMEPYSGEVWLIDRKDGQLYGLEIN